MMYFCMGCMEEIEDRFTICPYCGYRLGTPKAETHFLDPGTVIKGRYLVGNVLGHGGFGITYIGYDGMLNRKIAIKEYFYRQCATREIGTSVVKVYTGDAQWQFRQGLDSFLKEARQLAEFTGVPEIADVYDCVSENGTGYIVMEYVNGRDIRMILKERGQLSYEEVEEIILAVASGLSAVHKAGIIHRDIAPDNIMINEKGKVKIVDFGAARQVVASYSQDLSVIFKSGYAPVEQYQEKGNQGPWTDIYALGATMYKMLTGVKPQASIDRVSGDRLKKPSDMGIQMPRSSESALMRCMTVNVNERIQNTEELAKELTKWKTEGDQPSGWIKAVVFIVVLVISAVLTWGSLNLVFGKLQLWDDTTAEVEHETETDVLETGTEKQEQ